MKLYNNLLLRLIPVMLSSLAGITVANAETVSFLGQTYQLASFNQKANPMWEFVRTPENVNNWTTLLTIVDRPEARTRQDLDRLSQGILDTYKSSGGRVLMAKTMADAAGTPYNYMVVAFDQPAQHRFELNFVKAVLGPKNAYMVIYGVRVADPRDYVTKSKTFLNEHSSEIGKALEKTQVPAPATLPRKEF